VSIDRRKQIVIQYTDGEVDTLPLYESKEVQRVIIVGIHPGLVAHQDGVMWEDEEDEEAGL
jgi:hypothetical protein